MVCCLILISSLQKLPVSTRPRFRDGHCLWTCYSPRGRTHIHTHHTHIHTLTHTHTSPTVTHTHAISNTHPRHTHTIHIFTHTPHTFSPHPHTHTHSGSQLWHFPPGPSHYQDDLRTRQETSPSTDKETAALISVRQDT